MTNVNLLWNWFGTQYVFNLFPLEVVENVNGTNFVYYEKTRLHNVYTHVLLHCQNSRQNHWTISGK